MPRYDYLCEKNGKTLEVSHDMNTKISTWGELCSAAGINPGNTPSDTPVKRLFAAPAIRTGSRSDIYDHEIPDSSGCGSGACGCC